MTRQDFNHIREWLQPQLDARGWSVEALADRCGLSRAAVYFYLTDVHRPSSNIMARICNELGVPAEQGLQQYTPKPVGRPRP